MSDTVSIACIAGEASGDASCAMLVRALREQLADACFWGVGGRRMAEAGVHLLYDSTHWGAVGVVEALRIAPALWWAQQQLKHRLRENPPHLLLLVDFGAFNVPLAKWAKTRGIKVFYYFPPGSWRRTLSPNSDLPRCTDCIVTPFPWSAELLRAAGANAYFLGHPLLDRVRCSLSEEQFCQKLQIDQPLRIGILPGSRRQEVQSLLSVLRRAAEALPVDAVFLVALAPSVEAEVVYRAFEGSPIRWRLVEGMTYEVMAYSHLLWCCSGTATLEAAILGTPMIILYRGSWLLNLEYRLRKRWLRLTHIGLPNILAQQRICPELIQEEASPPQIVEYTLALLPGTTAYQQQREALQQVKALLGTPGATQRAAQLVRECIRS